MKPASHPSARRRLISVALAYALIITLLTPSITEPAKASAQGHLTSFSTNGPGSQWWPRLRALFLGMGAGQTQKRRMPGGSQPRPVIRPPAPPPTTEELRARVARVEITATGEVTLAPGQRLAVGAIPMDAAGRIVHGLVPRWESSVSDVVSVSPSGEVRALSGGTAELTAEAGQARAVLPVRVLAATTAPDDTKAGASEDGPRENEAPSVARDIQPNLRPPDEDPLPPGETSSLYEPRNDVGRPPGRTEPGAQTPPASTGGTETPGSLNFSFAVPVAALPGRGVDVSLAMTYNSRLWHRAGNNIYYDVDSGWPAPGFQLGYGHVEYQGDSFTLTDGDGTRHQLVKVEPGDPNDHNYETVDGTFIHFVASYHIGTFLGGTVTHSDGTRVDYGAKGTVWDDAVRIYPIKITDRNGNFIQLGYPDNMGPRIATIQDTLARTISFHYDAAGDLVTIKVPGYDETDDRQAIRFYYQDLTLSQSFQGLTPVAPATARVVKYIHFPGTRAGFRYDYSDYGMIASTVQLRNMTISTMETTQTGTVTAEGQTAATSVYDYPMGSSNLTDAPKYTQRTDTYAGQTSPPTVYGFGPDPSEPGVTTVTAPDGTVTETKTIVNAGQWDDGLVDEVTVKFGSNILRKVKNEWEHDDSNPNNPRNHRVKRVWITDDALEVRKIEFSYTSFNNVSEVREYGFSNELLRRNVSEYETSTGYLNRRILRLPTTIKVFAPGAGTPAIQTDFAYDEGAALSQTPGVMMHDATTDAHRGNLTDVTRYPDPGSPGTAILDTMDYDITGNVVKMTMDCCREKRFKYSVDYLYAYLIEETRGSQALGVELSTEATYDFNTGVVRTVEDENDQITTFHYYEDPVRHFRTERPDGGFTETEYQDALVADPAPHLHSFVKTTFRLDATRNVSRFQYFDGRGMLARSFGFNDPARGDTGTVDLEYDAMGRLLRSSNPYYAPQGPNTAVNPTNLWTTNRYDGLGRVDLVTLPDGTTVSTLYQGKVVTVTDQAEKKRRSVSDALGRLEHLDEPNISGNLDENGQPAQRTTYLYNVRDNLLRVTQGQQSRYFRYDGLSRLTHERHVEQNAPHAFTDPETGNNQWSRRIDYNGQSLVMDTYDARNVHTHFEYDGVNRLKEITHSGETSPATPRATLFYDEAQTGFFNKARLTRAVTDATAETPATEAKFDYDQMGRVKNQTQTILPALGTANYAMSYTYNFLDQLTSETYPSGRVVANGFDDAARLNQASDQFRTYSSLMAYTAQGTLESETWGNGAVHTMTYNERLQLQRLRLVRSGNEVQRFDYAYGQVNINDGTIDATKNNGQIGRIENFVNGAQRDEHRYVYDALGRLEAMRGVRDGTAEYRLHYSYDRFGNRYQPAGDAENVNIRYTPVETSHIDTNTNRFTAATMVQYDASGNVTTDGKFRGLSYRYDANNRMTQAQWDDVGVSNSVYDALGQRVRTLISGEWHHYVYDAMGRVIAEYGPSGQSAQGGLVRERIYRGGQLVATDELVGTCRRTASQFVREFYWGALGRQPNPQELGQWAALIGASFGQARLNHAKALGDTIFTSDDYDGRLRTDEEFVADLYWTYLQRPADVDGLKFWVERIALQGREGVREGFELSNEFAAHVADICSPGEPTGEVLWVMQDHQGSTRAMLNSAGQVVGRHDALPFGDTTGEANEVGPQAPEDETTGQHGWWNTIRQRYADLERDAATGLEHATFRKYEPWAGRWTSPDPYLGSMNSSDPQSFNRYAYVQNDPVNFVDPSGLLFWTPNIGSFSVDIGIRTGDGPLSTMVLHSLLFVPGGSSVGDTGGGTGEPQNTQPPVDVGGVRDKIAEWLKNPDCSAYVSKLINEAARQNRGNPAVSTNLLDIFDSVNAQGRFQRLQVGTRQNPSYSHVTGSIPKGTATVYLAPLKLYADMSAAEITRDALSLDPLGTFHELTHLAGRKQYNDLQLSRAAHGLGGPALPKDRNNKNLAFSRYLDDELKRNCGIR